MDEVLGTAKFGKLAFLLGLAEVGHDNYAKFPLAEDGGGVPGRQDFEAIVVGRERRTAILLDPGAFADGPERSVAESDYDVGLDSIDLSPKARDFGGELGPDIFRLGEGAVEINGLGL